MPELSTETLPLLPLTSGVVLPGMVVTIALETPEARSASSAAGDTGGHLLLVPKVDGRYANVGTVAKIEDAGELPSGRCAAWSCAACTGPASAPACPAPATALWVAGRAGRRDRRPPSGPCELAREYRAVVENILEARGAGRSGRAPARHDRARRHGRHRRLLARPVASSRRSRCSRRVDVEARLRLVLGWARDTLAELTLQGAHPHRRRRGHGEDPARVPAAPAAGRHPQGAGRGRRRRAARPTTTGPSSTDAARCPTPCARRSSGSSTGWSGPASRAPSTAGSAPGSTPCSSCRGASGPSDSLDVAEAAPHPRRRPHRPRRREGPHHRAPGRAQAARPSAGLADRVGGRGAGRHHRPGRSSRRRQDVAGRVGGPGPGPQVRPGRPGRRPRRGRDPRPPAHLRRRPARPHRPGHAGRPGP